jgi:hypothetical protein
MKSPNATSPSSDGPLDLAGRKGLAFYQRNGPVGLFVPGEPSRRVRIDLLRRGLLCISPLRRLGDPIKYDITERGRDYLKGFET